METKQSQTSPAARENIMGTMEINPLLVKLSVPMMISMLVQALHLRNRLFQVIVVLPHLRVTGIATHPGVRHIENVV